MTREQRLKRFAATCVSLLLSLAAVGLQGCVESDSEDLRYVMQECDAVQSSIDPDSGLFFYECSSPWREVANQRLFVGPFDCEIAIETLQESNPLIVQSQPDIDGRSLLLQCDSIIV